MTVDPKELLVEIAPENIPLAEPPEIANYREADMAGITCAFCAKFAYTGDRSAAGGSDIAIPTGVCEQWEASVDGVHVCDRFASGIPTFDDQGNEVWEFANPQERTFNEVHFAGGEVIEEREEDGSKFVIKEILRTGEWPVIPTKGGLVNKPLRIIRDGVSDKETGTIAMEEVVANFQAGAIPSPQIPLTDEEREDHKNLTRLNTGFVRDLWITDGDESSKLVAKLEFTEPDVGDKVLRGTYADVSCGIPWQVRSRGQEYGACLEHVAITNKPFIDGLGPFLAASDGELNVEINHFGQPPKYELTLSANQLTETVGDLLHSQLKLADHYEVRDVNAAEHNAVVTSTIAEQSWTVPFAVGEENSITLSTIDEWKPVEEEEGERDAPAEQKPAAPRQSSDDELEAAYREREIRLSDSRPIPDEGSGQMTLTQAELDRLDLSDDARAAFQKTLDENATLRSKTRTGEADKRITELEDLGLKDRPGALKLYRDVMLSDDGGPAVVLLSDNGQEKQRIGAKELLDSFISALKGEDGKVQLSDQHLASGNDNKPPETAEAENEKPVEERTSAAREALYGSKK